MSQFNEFIREHFSFLQQYGYICLEENSENIVSFVGKNNRIDIIFSAVGYELTCQFVDRGKNTFTLQDGLGYVNIKELEKGIAYLAAHIFDFTINLLIVVFGELQMQYHQIIYREVFYV